MSLLALRVGGHDLLSGDSANVPSHDRVFFTFSCPVDTSGIKNEIRLLLEGTPMAYELETFDSNQSLALVLPAPLQEGRDYRIEVSSGIRGSCGRYGGMEKSFTIRITPFELLAVTSGSQEADLTLGVIRGLGLRPDLILEFSDEVTLEDLRGSVSMAGPGSPPFYVVSKSSATTFEIAFGNDLAGFSQYTFFISDELESTFGRPFPGLELDLYTDGDTTYKFPEITDEELLTKIQEQTFKYFWDFGHPVSGLSRERNTSGDLVTIGGSGFGVMAIIVAIERGFITRAQGLDRLTTIVDFLGQKADRFHGVWSHWLSGSTGSVIPFSSNDDGGDLVETAFMVHGLYTLRQYLDAGVPAENSLIGKINTLIDGVEWDWYTQGGQNVLYWHWSPNFGWEKNHRISGWNEALIIYVLAASSATHPISRQVYEQGWARNGNMVNTSGNTYYGYQLPLRSDRGGPLFFAHYSFLGLDPRNLEDQYANYWDQNVTHTRINRAYCVSNPKQYIGYSDRCWGLTASDGNNGYSAHSPDNDRGVITPTAALSSMPYTPEESMEAARFFYYVLGDKIWGQYGFNDAFNLTAGWYADSYLAIDQGPIICMIENYRTGLLWDLFMSAEEVLDGLDKLGFTHE